MRASPIALIFFATAADAVVMPNTGSLEACHARVMNEVQQHCNFDGSGRPAPEGCRPTRLNSYEYLSAGNPIHRYLAEVQLPNGIWGAVDRGYCDTINLPCEHQWREGADGLLECRPPRSGYRVCVEYNDQYGPVPIPASDVYMHQINTSVGLLSSSTTIYPSVPDDIQPGHGDSFCRVFEDGNRATKDTISERIRNEVDWEAVGRWTNNLRDDPVSITVTATDDDGDPIPVTVTVIPVDGQSEPTGPERSAPSNGVSTTVPTPSSHAGSYKIGISSND